MPLSAGAVITAGSLLALAADHGSQGTVLGLTVAMFFGIGLAFASIPNLIVDAVPATQTGQATGVNTLLRSVGSSLGSQIVASILAGSVTATRLVPTEHSYIVAFIVAAGVALAAAASAALIPRGAGPHSLPVLEEIGAAAPLGEPALAADRD